jgi:OOP family OmpA-OmpF porin
MKQIRSGALLLCGLWAGQAAAVNVDGQDIPYASLQYAHEFAADARDSDGGNGYQLTFGLPLEMLNFNLPFSKENTAAEVSFYDVGRKRNIDDNKDYQTVLAFDLVRDFGTYDWKGTETGKYLPKFKPFGLLGLEAISEDVRGNRHYHAGVNVGGGLLFPLPWYGAAVRTEGRLQLQSNTKSVPDKNFLMDFRLTLGVQIPLSFLFKEQAAHAQPASCDVAVVPVGGAPRADCDTKPVATSSCVVPVAGESVDANGCAASPPETAPAK